MQLAALVFRGTSLIFKGSVHLPASERFVIDSQSRLVAAPDLVSSDLGGEAVILSMRDGMYYGLDAVGARVWELLQQPRTVGELRDAIVDAFEVDPARCESDLIELLRDMAGRGLVQLDHGAAK